MKCTTGGNAIKGLVCTGMYLFNYSVNYFTNLIPHQHKIASESHKSSGPPPVFLSTPDLKEGKLSTDTRIKTAGKQTNVFGIIISAPEKKMPKETRLCTVWVQSVN